MSYYSRLSKSFEGALRLPLHNRTKYVLISDCHRGTGTANDNFFEKPEFIFRCPQTLLQTGLYLYRVRGRG